MVRFTALVVLFLAASIGCSHADEKFFGFNLDGKVINPLCLEHIHPWYSDNTIIVRSLILDYCQDSNWAADNDAVEVKGDVVSIKLNDSADSGTSSSTFSYQIIGKTTNGLYIARLPENEMAAYTIEEKVLATELFDRKPDKVRILTQVGLSFVPCLQKVWVEGNKVFLTKNVYDQDAAHADQCKPQIETVSYDVSP